MDLVALRPITLETLVFQTEDGVFRLAVAAKIAIALERGELEAAPEMLEHDRAPQKPRADVLFSGSAHVLGDEAEHAVRIVVERAEAGTLVRLVDKSLRVVGPTVAGKKASFSSLPLRYEHAYGGATSKINPIGIGADPGDARRPRILDPKSAKRTAGVGPVPRTWWWRTRALAGHDAAPVDALRRIPLAIDWSYFNAAPPDQQCAHLRGDETIVLQGVHPRRARVETRLPGLRVHVRIELAGRAPMDLPLVADTLAIEGDELRATLTFRGAVTVEDEDPTGRVLATIAALNAKPSWDDASSEHVPAAPLPTRAGITPAIPARTTETVPILSRSRMPIFTRMWQLRRDRDACVVIVKGTFKLTQGKPAVLSRAQRPPSGDEPHDEGGSVRYPSDHAPFKPAADVLLVGHAYPPEGADVARVRLRIASIDRSIVAIGDRTWSDSQIGNARRFERMPLRWERALGGPLSVDNPAGRGLRTGVAAPNLERPDALVRSPSDAPAPACFAPIDPAWRPRHDRLGSSGARWVERWPFFPDDFDWSYFNCAPTEQQVPYLAGDETYSISSVTPGGGELSGRLPRLRPRVFAQTTADAGGDFFEVVLRLDTVWFDADAGDVVLVWRGLIEVRDDEASELASLFLLDEDEDARFTVQEARGRFLSELAVQHPQHVDVDVAAPANDPVVSFVAKARPAPQAPSRESVLAAIAAGESMSGRDLSGVDLAGADLSGAKLDGAILARASLRDAQLRGASLVGANLAFVEADAASFEGADLRHADLHGASLDGARFVRATLESASFVAALATAADFTGALASKSSFRGASLGRARFDDADLGRGDLSSSSLDGASFLESKLIDCKLYDAAGERVRFDRAKLEDARFDRATLPRASFLGAKGDGATFERATIERATFEGARLRSANFARARLGRSVLSDGDFREASFRKADLRDAHLDRADLMRASFEGADLRFATLVGASLFEAETWRAKLDRADLSQAMLEGTKLAKSSR